MQKHTTHHISVTSKPVLICSYPNPYTHVGSPPFPRRYSHTWNWPSRAAQNKHLFNHCWTSSPVSVHAVPSGVPSSCRYHTRSICPSPYKPTEQTKVRKHDISTITLQTRPRDLPSPPLSRPRHDTGLCTVLSTRYPTLATLLDTLYMRKPSRM